MWTRDMDLREHPMKLKEDIKVEDSANQEMLKIDKKVAETGGRSVE